MGGINQKRKKQNVSQGGDFLDFSPRLLYDVSHKAKPIRIQVKLTRNVRIYSDSQIINVAETGAHC